MSHTLTESFEATVARGRRIAEAERKPATLGDAITAMAEAELDEYTVRPIPVMWTALTAITPHLDDDKRLLWWTELKHCLDRAKETADSGPRWDEVGIDWDDRAAEALQMLTGDTR